MLDKALRHCRTDTYSLIYLAKKATLDANHSVGLVEKILSSFDRIQMICDRVAWWLEPG
jgi:hypothetical protein